MKAKSNNLKRSQNGLGCLEVEFDENYWRQSQTIIDFDLQNDPRAAGGITR